MKTKKETSGGRFPFVTVGVTGLEPATAWSQTRNATNCATPRIHLSVFLKCDAKVLLFYDMSKYFQRKSAKTSSFGTSLDIYQLLELKIVLCVVVADVFHHLAYALLLIACEWDKSLLNVIAEEVTHCATEVLVTWI